jgi:NTP pyrophosphatase (non-canonical NTP hydrolase)
MKLTNEFDPIRNWAENKGILKNGNVKTQFIKLTEEVGELSRAILKNDNIEFVDAIGDCVVVLTNLAKLNGFNIEDCINSAYSVIEKRTGKMENGTFVKDGI